MILVIDNFDSFTYNLVQYLCELGRICRVFRNDAILVRDVQKLAPSCIVISPGPGNPNQAGISLALIEAFSGKIPILGVCMGHQCIGQFFGSKVIRARLPIHGKTDAIFHQNRGLFLNLPSPFLATRYHSLIVERKTLPDCLEVTAETQEGEIMGLQHREYSVYGVQFHPESYATEHGKVILENFLNLC